MAVEGVALTRNTDKPASLDSIDEVAGRKIIAIIERVERLETERKALADDTADVYGEAKSDGLDVKTIKKIVAMRRKDPAERSEEETVLALYMRAIGMEA